MSQVDRLLADLDVLFDLIGELDPQLLKRKSDEFRRGGFPAGHNSGRGHDPPLPLPDALDRQLDHAWDTNRFAIPAARRLLARAVQAQRTVVNVTALQPDDPDYECKAAGCHNRHDRPDGLCAACRKRAQRQRDACHLNQNLVT